MNYCCPPNYHAVEIDNQIGLRNNHIWGFLPEVRKVLRETYGSLSALIDVIHESCYSWLKVLLSVLSHDLTENLRFA